MVNRVKAVKPLDGLTLLVLFQNGEEKLYDVKQLFSVFPQFEVFMTNKALFDNIQVDTGGYGISWNDELDLDAEELWENGIETGQQREIDFQSHVGIELLKAREKVGMTQKELAKKTGVHQANISKIERGLANPSLSLLNRLASGMGMKMHVKFY